MDEKQAEQAQQRHTDQLQGAMLAPALADSPDLDDEARRSAEKVARENAERMAAENAGIDREQAAGGYVSAAAKNGYPDAYPEPKAVKTTAAKKTTGTRTQ